MDDQQAQYEAQIQAQAEADAEMAAQQAEGEAEQARMNAEDMTQNQTSGGIVFSKKTICKLCGSSDLHLFACPKYWESKLIEEAVKRFDQEFRNVGWIPEHKQRHIDFLSSEILTAITRTREEVVEALTKWARRYENSNFPKDNDYNCGYIRALVELDDYLATLTNTKNE